MNPALTSLLAELVDYAGLFPPAQLPMPDAVRAYADYRVGPHRGVLGRFVLPLARLDEFSTALAHLPAIAPAWPLSVIGTGDATADAAALLAFHHRQSAARIVSLEVKVATPADVTRATAGLPAELEVWLELAPRAADLPALLAAVKATGHGAKLRTGGVTPDAFPTPADVARFLRLCRDAGVVAKATAGLHHPLRGDFPLTYAPAAPHGRMFGFINVTLAAALLHAGGSEADATALLDDADAQAFQVHPDALSWRGTRFSADQLAATRRHLCRSFGSCSFTEPLEGLQQLSWL
jgi:hypothetical protein